jgi:hypothetical protein
MASQSSAAGGARRGRGSAAASDEWVLAAAAHLTSRDRQLVRAVGEHRVLTTGQLAALGFGSVITARHRLSVLVQIGVLRRFRPHRETGSAPWHYLLGLVGAALLGSEDGDDRRWLNAVRSDRQLALGRSQRLAHLVGVNWFFAALAGCARTAGAGAELRLWLPDPQPPPAGPRRRKHRHDRTGGSHNAEVGGAAGARTQDRRIMSPLL